MASEVLFDRKDCSTSGATLNAACKTSGDKAFHTDVLPAKCVNIGLQKHKKLKSFGLYSFFHIKNFKGNRREESLTQV